MLIHENDIKASAEKIAQLISAVDTDYRGDLIYLAAKELRLNGQGATAAHLEFIAAHYGLNREK